MDQILQILVQNGYIDQDSAKDLQDLAHRDVGAGGAAIVDQRGLVRKNCHSITSKFHLHVPCSPFYAASTGGVPPSPR